ncbi:MAG: ATP synthase F1 subunit delta [Candidatus Aminicenantes bacterium]|nr:ATP synthase F1 subunit delta [Candidatus Aminicenantes bacterium]
MNHQSLIKKYARGLVRTLKEEEFLAFNQQLKMLVDLMVTNPAVNFGLTSPFVPRTRRLEIIRELGEQQKLDRRLVNFLRLLVEHERMSLLKDIVKELETTWAEEHGFEVVEVSAAVELTDEEKERLRQTVEEIERKPVRLSFRLDPEIIGGLVLKKGNIFYDVSIKGHLLKLKEIISQG